MEDLFDEHVDDLVFVPVEVFLDFLDFLLGFLFELDLVLLVLFLKDISDETLLALSFFRSQRLSWPGTLRFRLRRRLEPT